MLPKNICTSCMLKKDRHVLTFCTAMSAEARGWSETKAVSCCRIIRIEDFSIDHTINCCNCFDFFWLRPTITILSWWVHTFGTWSNTSRSEFTWDWYQRLIFVSVSIRLSITESLYGFLIIWSWCTLDNWWNTQWLNWVKIYFDAKPGKNCYIQDRFLGEYH